jgi:hypothetical protein
MAAHEIQQALGAVLGNVALLLTQIDPGSDAHARAWRALDEVKRIRDIVSDMAAVSPVVASDRPRDAGSVVGVRSGWGRRRTHSPARKA